MTVSFRLGSGGWVLGARLETGPIVARAAAANALKTQGISYVGPDDAEGEGGVTVRWVRSRPVHIATGEEGGYVDGALAAPGARLTTLATDERESRVLGADERGIAWWRNGNDGIERVELGVDRRDVRTLAATLGSGRMLVLYALPDPVLGALLVPKSGAPVDRRLRLPAPVEHVDVEWVGERTAFACRLQGGAVYAGVFDAEGRTRVRPYELPSVRGSRTPRVVWRGQDFRVLAVGDDGAARAFEMGKTEPEAVIPGVAEPLDAVYFAGRYYFASMAPAAADGPARAVLRSAGPRGEETDRLEVPLRPVDEAERLTARRVRELLRRAMSAARAPAEAGYRGGRGAAHVELRDGALYVAGPTGESRVDVSPAGLACVIRARRPRLDADSTTTDEGDGFLQNVARRLLAFSRERDLDADEAGLVSALRQLPLVGEATLDVGAEDDHLELGFELPSVPSAAELAGLLALLGASTQRSEK